MKPATLILIIALAGFALAVALGAGAMLVYKLVTPGPVLAAVPAVNVQVPNCPRYPLYRCEDTQP